VFLSKIADDRSISPKILQIFSGTTFKSDQQRKRVIAINNKRVMAIQEQCDRLSDKELIQLANQYKEELL